MKKKKIIDPFLWRSGSGQRTADR